MANPIDEKMMIGTIGELLVQLRLLQYKIQAAPPIKDSGNDLVALKGRQIRLIQVKTTAKGTFPKLPGKKKIYDLLAIVYLRGYDRTLKLDDTKIFLIPKDHLPKINRNSLDDYKLEKVVNEYFRGSNQRLQRIANKSGSR
ncbi:MAG: hypothetical protein NTW12_13025 [Deltaproteobacteria bacterium]|nr:hypothetical protein [Deltaproteobacteria bacterium]